MKSLKFCVSMLLFLLLAGSAPAVPAFAGQAAILVSVDGKKLDLEVPPVIQGDRVMVSVRKLAESLRAQVDWDPATETATIVCGSRVVKLVNGSNVALLSGEPVRLDVPVRVEENRLLAPLRFLAESLGATVAWSNIEQKARIISAPPEGPERVCHASFPARVALTNNGHLWIVDGASAGSAPVQITNEGIAEIVGWSPDGWWLMYLHRDAPDLWSTPPYLWVVKADGSTGACQVDRRPVTGTPAWSPLEDAIAYGTQAPDQKNAPDGNLKLAVLDDGDSGTTGEAMITVLLPDESDVADFAWVPDGQSIAVSLPRNKECPLLINRIDLKGKSVNLLTHGEPNATEEYFYTRSATGLQWSPDGRYLAYYLEPSSGSMAADGVSIQVLDLQQSGQPLDLGSGLGYARWLAWSPDSTRLAYIVGCGRDATVNKRLYLADLQSGGKITDCGSAGQVDTQPVWSSNKPYSLLFNRGKEGGTWTGGDNFPDVLVPGQRIWLRADGGEVKSLTSGPADTADYAPKLSPNGETLAYLRLNRYDSGSLCLKPLTGGQDLELISGLTGDHGFYGNYYPEWLSIYWERDPD
ncbi:MAG TPA: copper amine oxidase [Pelotomaculum sp.]|nr:copper amine oxidase [Pelotomaculum sp.]